MRTEIKIQDGDMLTAIENLIHDHEALRGHIRLLRESVEKWRTILNFNGKSANPNSLPLIAEKQITFIQALGYLKDGLRGLHIQEEKIISILVDTLMLKAIQSAHAQIMKRIDNINTLIIKLKPDELIIRGENLTQAIDDLGDMIVEHSLIEDRMLQLLITRPFPQEHILQPA